MVAKSYIYNNIRQLNSLYETHSSVKGDLYYSKLALLELCGWIEESMDDIILRCGNRCLREQKNKVFVKKNIIKPTYGFSYERHFRKMLIQTIGIINVEMLEKKVDPVKFVGMDNALKALVRMRNSAAHTHLKGVTHRIDAPSVTMGHFLVIYDGLIEFQEALKSLGF